MATCGICKESRSNDHIRAHYAAKYAGNTPSPSQAPQPARASLNSAQRKPSLPQVPDGYYATRDSSNVVHFWRVTHNRAGYLKLAAMASDTGHPVRSYARRVGVLKQIAADIPGARKLYATELGRCYRCGRTLTDEESRANGIGPVCAGLQYA